MQIATTRQHIGDKTRDADKWGGEPPRWPSAASSRLLVRVCFALSLSRSRSPFLFVLCLARVCECFVCACDACFFFLSEYQQLHACIQQRGTRARRAATAAFFFLVYVHMYIVETRVQRAALASCLHGFKMDPFWLSYMFLLSGLLPGFYDLRIELHAHR